MKPKTPRNAPDPYNDMVEAFKAIHRDMSRAMIELDKWPAVFAVRDGFYTITKAIEIGRFDGDRVLPAVLAAVKPARDRCNSDPARKLWDQAAAKGMAYFVDDIARDDDPRSALESLSRFKSVIRRITRLEAAEAGKPRSRRGGKKP
jgi:hypothetical protein